jgi:hypothetical protein
MALVKVERMEAMCRRARELAAQGRYPQTVELLLVMEGFAVPLLSGLVSCLL